MYNKVFFVCNYAAKYGGNFLTSFHFLSNKLANNNIKIYFVFPIEAKKYNWEVDLSHFNVLYSKFDEKNIANTINSCLEERDSVIIHLNFVSSLYLIKLKNQINTKASYVFQQHMAVNFGIKQIIKGLILRTFAPQKTAYIGVSPEVYKDVKREVGIRKSYLIINAIDTRRLEPFHTIDNSNILIFGTDFKRKGVDLAIRAILHSKVKNKCKLIVVTHNKKDACDLIVNEFGVIPSFVRIASPVQDVRKLYNNSFLFLSPSRLEAFGYAVVEAAYSGVSVIASDVLGQNTLSTIPGVRMVPAEDVSSLRWEINNAFDHKDDNREKINKCARQYIDAHFSLESWANKILKVYGQFK